MNNLICTARPKFNLTPARPQIEGRTDESYLSGRLSSISKRLPTLFRMIQELFNQKQFLNAHNLIYGRISISPETAFTESFYYFTIEYRNDTHSGGNPMNPLIGHPLIGSFIDLANICGVFVGVIDHTSGSNDERD